MACKLEHGCAIRLENRCEPALTAQHRGDPQEQLAQMKRLGKVIVTARLKSGDAVVGFAFGTQKQHTGSQALEPRLTANVVTGKLGQHHVQQHQVGLLEPPLLERRLSIRGDADAVTLAAQVELEQFGERRFVFDNQDLGGQNLGVHA